jgi:hypothetical protein
MSKFLRQMEALSKKPSDFTRPQLVDPAKPTTVVDSSSTTVVDDKPTTVVDYPTTTVVDDQPTTVVAGSSDLWRSEGDGPLFPLSRVRPIVRAQDALNRAEESVYDVLWGAKDQSRDPYRIRQLGYGEVAHAARTTKRNAALIIERLIEKGFVSLEREADKKSPRQYRVFGYRAAIDNMGGRGRKWVVRSGNGILFVNPLNLTVVAGQSTTVVADQSTTVVAATTVTVVADQSTTVVAATTHLDSKNKALQDTSSSVLVKRLADLGIPIDDDAARRITSRCQNTDSRATVEEIAHFAELKVQQLAKRKNIENWPGMLMTSVPAYFDQPATELMRYRKGKQRERERQEQIAREILADSQSTEAECEGARSIVSSTSQDRRS